MQNTRHAMSKMIPKALASRAEGVIPVHKPDGDLDCLNYRSKFVGSLKIVRV